MGVDVRAVRQEMAKPRSMGWLVEKNEATEKKRGYRGRVSRWGSDTSQILQDTQKNWDSVGVVFVLRMEGRAGGILTLRAPSRFHAQYIESNNKSKTIEASKIIDQTINHVVII